MAKRKTSTKRKRTTERKAPAILPILPRRTVRYILFRIKRDMTHTMDRDLRVHADAMTKHFEKEIEEKGLAMKDFTFTWDVSPDNPYKVIRIGVREWVMEGGSFEGRPPGMESRAWARHVLSTLLDRQDRPLVPYDPPAFTRQV
jgi:hypothetical protein